MKKSAISRLIAGAVMAAAPLLASAATYTYVGSWSPYSANAPVWFGSPPNGPLAYTGQEAAALLFGGVASDYAISTVDDQVADINFMSWYDVIGLGGHQFSQDHFAKYLGQYYGPTSGYGNLPLEETAASAYVRDNNVTGVNYAFRITAAAVPEPESYALMIAGLGLFGVMRRRKSA